MSARLLVGLGLGLAFLYLPIVVLVAFSFNDSPLLTSWSGFSLRWYAALLGNERMLRAAGLSVAIAAASATLATAVGAAAGLAMSRMGRFRMRGVLGAALAALLVMPEILAGVTLLLLFVAMERATGWPAERGAATVTIAHATFAIAYVATVVQARLADQDPALEEAAADLGARPAEILHAVARRPGGGELRLRPGRDDPADARLLERAPWPVAADQRAGDADAGGGRRGAARGEAGAAPGHGAGGTRRVMAGKGR